MLSRPNEAQGLLLQAALLDGDAAREAWTRWLSENDLETSDLASFFVFPLVYWNLTRLGVVDEIVTGKLRGVYRFAWAKNTFALNALVDVRSRLESAGVPSLMLKGLPLPLFFYPDRGLRLMSDVDILIRPEQSGDAQSALAPDWNPERELPPDSLLEYVHALTFRRAGRLALDLHWRPFGYDCPAERALQFWNETSARSLDGVPVEIPDVENLLLLSVIQRLKGDPQAACRWVADMVMLIRDPGEQAIRWAVVRDRAAKLGILEAAADSLAFLRDENLILEGPEWAARAERSGEGLADRYRSFASPLANDKAAGAGLRGVSNLIRQHWWRYRGVRHGSGSLATPWGFLHYASTYQKWIWELPSVFGLPLAAWRRLRKRSS